ncbi:hypothetical protein [Piscinibacter sp. HJYY11]|uniref:hypothetical protein n=1 Tax=Piscinibacter sp. HJYY11 TaxID=2801333 RepID=UPI00191F071E|nr:hypothetical protein [Piscinibacter sp. HJYY11]MBL0729842.1 hypothetical protein [Piscinibacter sp. HJYY11]
MSKEDQEIFYKLVKAGAKQSVKHGAAKLDLSDEVAAFLAEQLSFTFDLVKKGASLSAGELTVRLLQKNLSIARIAADKRFDCAIAFTVLGLSLTKAVAYTTFTGPAHFAVTAVELLAECYSVDKSCGISDAAYQAAEKVALPAAMWLEQGIVQWMSRGGY